jgi:nucleotide-binding universal stress UspA family protein
MTHRHGPADLLGPEDAVRLDHDGHHRDDHQDDHCHRPRIVAALGELPGDEPVLVEAVEAADRLDGELFLLHAVPVSFAERSVGLDEAVHRGERLLADATTMAIARGRAPKEARLVRVRPHELVGEGLDADILVIGGPRAGGARRLGRVVGTATGHAPCTILVVPRAG